MRATVHQRSDQLHQERVARAFEFLRCWNDPNLAEMRGIWRSVVREASGKTDHDVVAIFKRDAATKTAVSDILNFFEEMAYAARVGVADITTLKKTMKSVVVHYWSISDAFIEQHRTDKSQPSAHEHFEWLAKKWASE